jgi:hypothetical protein
VGRAQKGAGERGARRDRLFSACMRTRGHDSCGEDGAERAGPWCSDLGARGGGRETALTNWAHDAGRGGSRRDWGGWRR